ncbi:MAG: DDE-type integrase/transposase/recombinase [Candidatus Obscuribacter sp.]|nr:DDE-type integrase/transposase/recombinase [Candidatus Obscuribacter sp.]
MAIKEACDAVALPQATYYRQTKITVVNKCPNQVWAWDVTKLKGPHAWQFYFLYTIVDLYSRKVVGWMVAERENAKHAKHAYSPAWE